jgi:hypothetical protein
MIIWYIFLRFGILYQEKSGNPVSEIYQKKGLFRRSCRRRRRRAHLTRAAIIAADRLEPDCFWQAEEAAFVFLCVNWNWQRQAVKRC